MRRNSNVEKVKDSEDEANSSHPVRHGLLELVIEETFVNSALSS